MVTEKFVYVIHNTHSILLINHTQAKMEDEKKVEIKVKAEITDKIKVIS
jgi:hypothetical protein